MQHELNRIVNAYKRIKKYEVRDNSLLQEHSLALKETSKEGKDKEIDRNSAHKSQKISHKR